MRILSVPILATALLSIPATAFAMCFEDLGDPGCTDQAALAKSDVERLSCENLRHVRNSIFADNNYCFKTTRGKELYGNSTCSVDDANLVKMNSYEWTNLSTIRAVEQDKGCQ